MAAVASFALQCTNDRVQPQITSPLTYFLVNTRVSIPQSFSVGLFLSSFSDPFFFSSASSSSSPSFSFCFISLLFVCIDSSAVLGILEGFSEILSAFQREGDLFMLVSNVFL